jgi:endonuclease-3
MTVPRLDRATRAARIAQILDAKFPVVDSALDHANPFQLLVATILSAQCTDARVNVVTPALFARAPDARTMAKMRAREILPYIKSCGLAPGKAKRLAAMSRALVNKHGGDVPRDMEALEELPGVGHKTAGVVLAQAFGDEQFPVDTHIHRLAGRWGLSYARDVDEVERDLKALFPPESWRARHLQIIYFGRSECPARGHDPKACTICSWAISKSRIADEERAEKASLARRAATLERKRQLAAEDLRRRKKRTRRSNVTKLRRMNQR